MINKNSDVYAGYEGLYAAIYKQARDEEYQWVKRRLMQTLEERRCGLRAMSEYLRAIDTEIRKYLAVVLQREAEDYPEGYGMTRKRLGAFVWKKAEDFKC